MKRIVPLICLLIFCNVCHAQRHAVKTTFLSWSTGSSKISYEWAAKASAMSSEAAVAVICAGFDKYQNNPLGISLRYAE